MLDIIDESGEIKETEPLPPSTEPMLSVDPEAITEEMPVLEDPSEDLPDAPEDLPDDPEPVTIPADEPKEIEPAEPVKTPEELEEERLALEAAAQAEIERLAEEAARNAAEEAARIAAELEAVRLALVETQKPRALELLEYAVITVNRGMVAQKLAALEPEALEWAKNEAVRKAEAEKSAMNGKRVAPVIQGEAAGKVVIEVVEKAKAHKKSR